MSLRWFTDPPELRTALEERQTADTALDKHKRWMTERYGHRGVPPEAPERRETDRLESVAWEKFDAVREVTAKLAAQKLWDRQIQQNREPFPFDRRARVADLLGLNRTAAAIRDGIDVASRIADNMEACPNNPRNGGDGYDRGDGRWTDRRDAEWQYAEERRTREREQPVPHRERDRLAPVSRLTRDEPLEHNDER